MKKIIFLMEILCILVIILGCKQNINVIQKINSITQNRDNFISVSVEKTPYRVAATNIYKYGNLIIKATIINDLNSSIDIRELDFTNLDMPIVILCHICDYENQNYKRIRLYPDGSIIIDDDKKMYDNFPKDIYFQTGWEDTPRGLAISPNSIKLKYENKLELNDQEWQMFKGKYDFSKEYVLVPAEARKGELTFFYNEDFYTGTEVYSSILGEPIVIRRFWLDKEISFDCEKISYNYLYNKFRAYCEEAQFNSFLEMCDH